MIYGIFTKTVVIKDDLSGLVSLLSECDIRLHEIKEELQQCKECKKVIDGVVLGLNNMVASLEKAYRDQFTGRSPLIFTGREHIDNVVNSIEAVRFGVSNNDSKVFSCKLHKKLRKEARDLWIKRTHYISAMKK